jgi:GntR family transcriptional regulator
MASNAALRPGEQLPGIRPLAEELVINPNTVAKAYRDSARRRHRAPPRRRRLRVGAGARGDQLAPAGQASSPPPWSGCMRAATDEEIRRLFEAELAG